MIAVLTSSFVLNVSSIMTRRRQRARQRINSARETVEGILGRIRDKVSRPGEVNFHVSPCYLTKENAGWEER